MIMDFVGLALDDDHVVVAGVEIDVKELQDVEEQWAAKDLVQSLGCGIGIENMDQDEMVGLDECFADRVEAVAVLVDSHIQEMKCLYDCCQPIFQQNQASCHLDR